MTVSIVLLAIQTVLFLQFIDVLRLLYSSNGLLSFYDSTVNPLGVSAFIVVMLVSFSLFSSFVYLLQRLLKQDSSSPGYGVVVSVLVTMLGLALLVVINNIPPPNSF